MGDQDIHIHVRQIPTLPPLLAMALLMMICGVFVAVYNFFAHNTDVLICLVITPLTAWFAIGRRMRRNGHPYRAALVTLGAVILAIVSGNVYFEYHHSQVLAQAAAQAKIYAEQEKLREPEYKNKCLARLSELRPDRLVQLFDIDHCKQFYTTEQIVNVCSMYSKSNINAASGGGTCANLGFPLSFNHPYVRQNY